MTINHHQVQVVSLHLRFTLVWWCSVNTTGSCSHATLLSCALLALTCPRGFNHYRWQFSQHQEYSKQVLFSLLQNTVRNLNLQKYCILHIALKLNIKAVCVTFFNLSFFYCSCRKQVWLLVLTLVLQPRLARISQN